MDRGIYIEVTLGEDMGMDFIDLTDLQRRGLLRKAEELARISRDGPEVLDFTDARMNVALGNAQSIPNLGLPSLPSPMQNLSPAPSDSSMDFLSSFAQVGAQNSPSGPSEPSLPHHGHGHSAIEPKLDTILAKLEDTMFKIEVLSNRILQIESRFKS